MSPDRPFHICTAEPSMAPRLTEIAHSSKRYWGYDEADIERWSRELTVTEKFIGEYIVNVVVSVDAPIGFYALAIAGTVAEVEHFWVHPDSIGCGVGRQMFAHAADAAREFGAAAMRIVSDPNAQGFYEKMGATVVGTEPSSPPGRRLPVLALSLESA